MTDNSDSPRGPDGSPPCPICKSNDTIVYPDNPFSKSKGSLGRLGRWQARLSEIFNRRAPTPKLRMGAYIIECRKCGAKCPIRYL